MLIPGLAGLWIRSSCNVQLIPYTVNSEAFLIIRNFPPSRDQLYFGLARVLYKYMSLIFPRLFHPQTITFSSLVMSPLPPPVLKQSHWITCWKMCRVRPHQQLNFHFNRRSAALCFSWKINNLLIIRESGRNAGWGAGRDRGHTHQTENTKRSEKQGWKMPLPNSAHFPLRSDCSGPLKALCLWAHFLSV